MTVLGTVLSWLRDGKARLQTNHALMIFERPGRFESIWTNDAVLVATEPITQGL